MDKYVYPVTQRTFLAIVTVVSFITAVVAIIILVSLLPLSERVPLAVSVGSRVDEYTGVKYIGKQEEDSNDSVVKYLTGRYIKMRESYDFENLKNIIEYVRYYTEPADFQNYNTFMSTETNPNSPILVYRNHTKRSIEIIDVVKISREEAGITTPGVQRIVASFKVTEKGLGQEKTSLWKARVDVHFSDVVYYKDTKKFAPLDFKVIHYEAKQVEG